MTDALPIPASSQGAASTRGTRILFLCPALAPGQSGVGDHARRLAAECLRQGAEARVVSLFEPQTTQRSWHGDLLDSETRLSCAQLPAGWDWQQRAMELQAIVDEWQPDWISLQFVPFGYHSKGLPMGLLSMLKSLSGSHRWQIMFHEAWVGAFVGTGLKLRLLGMLQKAIVGRLLTVLKPAVVHTQAQPHVRLLQKLGCRVNHLPLFGNIPFVPDGAAAGRRLIFGGPPVVGTFPPTDEPASTWMIGGVFGAVHPEWRPEAFFAQWMEAAQASGRTPLLVFLGRHGRPEKDLYDLAASFAGRITVRLLESLPEAQISQVLQVLDFGMVSTPWQLREKSSSLVTLAEHGLTTIITRDDWKLRGGSKEGSAEVDDSLFCLSANACSSKTLARLCRRAEFAPRLPQVAAQFLTALHAHAL